MNHLLSYEKLTYEVTPWSRVKAAGAASFFCWQGWGARDGGDMLKL